MASILSKVSPIDNTTYGNEVKTLRVLIECVKGSVHKCEFDDEIGAMVVVRDLDKRYPYLYNYGCIPQTLAEDGDNLDAIVITDEPLFSGLLVNCFPLGIVRMVDHGEQDDKLICTPFYKTDGVIDLKPIFNYLRKYKYPEKPGVTQLTGFEGADAAWLAVEEAHKAWLASGGKK